MVDHVISKVVLGLIWICVKMMREYATNSSEKQESTLAVAGGAAPICATPKWIGATTRLNMESEAVSGLGHGVRKLFWP